MEIIWLGHSCFLIRGKEKTIITDPCHHDLGYRLGEPEAENLFDTVFMVADEASLMEAAEKLNPDLIIADLSLPGTGELNVVRRIKKAFPRIKLIVLSIHDEKAAFGECIEAGANGIVLKRKAVDDLVPAVEAVLRGGACVPTSAAIP